MNLIITNLEHFSSCIATNLEDLDWVTKRDIIRTLVKRVEMDHEEVNVVFRVQDLPSVTEPTDGGAQGNSQHCWRGKKAYCWYAWCCSP